MKQHLVLSNITKIMGGREVLKNISFNLPLRKTLAVIGPSGSGKSTLLRTINRLTEIESGCIYLNGTNIKMMDPIKLRRRIGLVHQKPEMFEGKVYHNLRYALDLQHKFNRNKIMEALRDAELESSFLYRDASKLSLGEQQRVAIARALTLEPEILLFDEPTSALDNRITRNFETSIKQLKGSRGLTIIWVTHDNEQARRIGDFTVVLKKGRLQQFGPTDYIEIRSTRHKPAIRNSAGGD